MKILIKAILPILLLVLTGCAHHRNYHRHNSGHSYDRSYNHRYSNDHYYPGTYDTHIYVDSPDERRRHPKPSKHQKPYVYRSSPQRNHLHSNINRSHKSDRHKKHRVDKPLRRSKQSYTTESNSNRRFSSTRQTQKHQKLQTSNSFSSHKSASKERNDSNNNYSAREQSSSSPNRQSKHSKGSGKRYKSLR